MSVGINFGSATSGAGFDVTSTVSSIMAIQRKPEAAWATQTATLQAKDTALTSLGSSLSALSSSLSSLTSFDGVFAGKQGATSDTNSVVLTNVGSTAAIGSHTLTVSTLAKTSQQYSAAVASGATVSGTLSFMVGSGSATTLTVPSGSSMAQVAAQINASAAGVKASVVSDSSGSRLSFVSGTGGTTGELTLGGTLTDSSGNQVGYTRSQAGVDAAYTIDGISLTSGSNTVSSALSGVSFQIVGITSSPVTLQVAADNTSVTASLNSFVSAYNTLSKALVAQEGKDSSGNPQPLFGSNVISQIQSALSNALSFQDPNAPSNSSSSKVSLATLGVSVGTDGTMSLNSSALNTALTRNFDGVATFFQSVGQFGQNFASALSASGNSGNGTIALASKNNADEEANLAKNKTDLEARLTAYQANLTAELNTANQILQSIPQQLSGLTQMFNSITGYKGGY